MLPSIDEECVILEPDGNTAGSWLISIAARMTTWLHSHFGTWGLIFLALCSLSYAASHVLRVFQKVALMQFCKSLGGLSWIIIFFVAGWRAGLLALPIVFAVSCIGALAARWLRESNDRISIQPIAAPPQDAPNSQPPKRSEPHLPPSPAAGLLAQLENSSVTPTGNTPAATLPGKNISGYWDKLATHPRFKRGISGMKAFILPGQPPPIQTAEPNNQPAANAEILGIINKPTAICHKVKMPPKLLKSLHLPLFALGVYNCYQFIAYFVVVWRSLHSQGITHAYLMVMAFIASMWIVVGGAMCFAGNIAIRNLENNSVIMTIGLAVFGAVGSLVGPALIEQGYFLFIVWIHTVLFR